MGARLVGAAFVFGTRHDLKGNEARVLAFMALRALDTDTTPRYFAAREETAQALGYLVPDEPRPDDPDLAAAMRARSAAFRRVSEAITGLIDHGALRVIRRAQTGQRAEYALKVGQALDLVEKCKGCGRERDGNRRPVVDGNRRPVVDGNRPASTTETVDPRNQEEPLEEKELGNTSTSSTTSLAPVDSSSEKRMDQSFEKGAA